MTEQQRKALINLLEKLVMDIEKAQREQRYQHTKQQKQQEYSLGEHLIGVSFFDWLSK